MRPARTYPERRDDVRLLVIDPELPAPRALREARTTVLADFLDAGDLLVVNDAATLPASLAGVDIHGRAVEARLIAARDGERFAAVLFGAGDWRQRTEDRPPPPALPVGAGLRFGELGARVVAHDPRSARLVELEFAARGDALWAALYRVGRPVQYSHLAHDLPLWAVQTVYAARPWSFEMPSAGRPLSWQTLLALRRKGVRWAALTHAAGLSATGDPALDAALPLPERYDIPAATVRADEETRARGGRVVEGVLSGAHAATESHFQLLAAFAGHALLDAAADHAERAGFLTHELGDSMLVLRGALSVAASMAAERDGARVSA